MADSPLTDKQKKSIKKILTESPYCVLGLKPGQGKSRVCIEVQSRLKKRTLVVCPSYLIQVWVTEIEKWNPKAKYKTITKGGHIIQYSNLEYDFIITSYDLAQKYEPLFEWAYMVVADEAHYLKSIRAKRTEYFHRVIFENSIKRLILVTGTPIKNRVEEFYSLLALTHYNPRIKEPEFLEKYPDSITFADHFSHRVDHTLKLPDGRFIPIVKWKGIRNLPELKSYLKNNYLRFKSEDKGLPGITYIPVLTSDKIDERVKAAFEDFIRNTGELGNSVAPDIKAQAALEKSTITIKYAESLLEQTGSLIIYSDHIAPVERIAKFFKVEPITGKTPNKVRARIVENFQNKKINLIVATIGALSTGVTLTRANHLILNDYPWVPGDLEQVVRRIRRLGQVNHCYIHEIMSGPQDIYIVKSIKEKLKVIDLVV